MKQFQLPHIFLPTIGTIMFIVSHAQKVGIGTNTPAALLHVADGSVVFTGPQSPPDNSPPSIVPAIGDGHRMMWIPERAALRVGAIMGNKL